MQNWKKNLISRFGGGEVHDEQTDERTVIDAMVHFDNHLETKRIENFTLFDGHTSIINKYKNKIIRKDVMQSVLSILNSVLALG